LPYLAGKMFFMWALFVEIIGWIASVLIVGAYYLNIRGKLTAGSPAYIWANMVGGLFFVINTFWHGAYPSAVVNVIWVIIAVAALFKKRKRSPVTSS
jgi:hypothetical protein